MQNRQKDEIVRDILTVCNGGAPITRVMFHAYMTHGQAKAYLGELVTNGLVEHDTLERKFHATQKGIQYLAVIERMNELSPIAVRRAALS